MKTRNRNDLATAQLLFARKKYGQVISLLVPQIVLYRKEARFHEILGLSCLHTGDFGGAYSYLKRARDIEPHKISTLLGLAIVMLRRRKVTDALGIWLEILDIDPGNARAQRALNLAKTYSEEDWLQFIEDERHVSILSKHNSFLLRRVALPVLTSLAVVAGLVLIIFLIPERELPYRGNAELLEFDQSDYSQGDYSQFASIIFTEQELKKKLGEIQRYYHQYRDNMVRYHGNQVLMSNAPLGIKDRISFIITQLSVPDFTNFQDPFTYQQVLSAPHLYNGVYIRWKGRVANVLLSEDLITFDLLIGFESGRVVQGTVPVLLDFAHTLAGGESLEVIAQVGQAVSSNGNSGITLRASALRLIIGNNE